MKLRIFDGGSKSQWIGSGYRYVKITYSKDIGLKDTLTGEFYLLEPYLNEDEALEDESVVDINSPEIEEIMQNKTGRYYQ
ncbi:hypothetical protein [Pedobacter sp. SYSU D00535]|uniref:hypothetical protein n=1 Tax=Pedobacter sp. SYSU D00535 TaxID=2810308 RepID=UPI001A96DFEE|nr:hypothetical protein [Pedobacter sp. SYSU D00535]